MTTTDQPMLDFDAVAQVEAPAAQAYHQDVAGLIATDPRKASDFERFVDALRADAATHGGCISQNRVRLALSDDDGLVIDPHAYSGMWQRAARGRKTGPEDERHPPLIRQLGLEDCTTSRSGNNHKPQRTYEWIGPL